MGLQYYIQSSENLNPGAGKHHSISRNTETITFEKVLDYVTRAGSTVTRAEAVACFEECAQYARAMLEEGHRVETPLVTLYSRLKGRFDDESDRFDPGRHEVKIRSEPGRRMKKAAPNIIPEKVLPRERNPQPNHYHDSLSDSRDDIITPGGGARITGSLLKIDPGDGEQGIFFVNGARGEAIPVDDTSILLNKPSELIFTNPDLPPGTYRLEVRTIPQRVTVIRRGSLSAELVVE